MTDIKQIQHKIGKLYKARKEPAVNVTPAMKVRRLASFAKTYIAAASIVEKEGPQHWLPILQMTGHAVELSLKACLVAADKTPPNKHDLIELYEIAEKFGFQLDDSHKAMIVHLQHLYFQDLATNTPYKARYPTDQTEPLSGSVPKNEIFNSIILSLIEQAEQKIDGDE